MLNRLIGPLAMLAAVAPAPANVQVQVQAPRPAASATAPWHAAGSDIPADPDWRTGTLPNGLRWAVRRNALPPGAVSIRVRIDVGALMEADDEQGWAHLLEHMTFRGSANYPDGEAQRVWQRLGARVGADSNAFTGLTSTTYHLDLPRADAGSLREAMGVLAEMVASARIDPSLLATERGVVLAERAARLPPLAARIREVSRPVLLTGLKAEKRDVIGRAETLANASAERLRAFYKRWYRPSRATVVAVGDADPALLEAAIRARFGGWAGSGPEPAAPDWGALAEPAAPVAVVSDPQAPSIAEVTWSAPHDERPLTAARQGERYLEGLAVAILRERLASAARQGGAIITARVSRGEMRRGADSVTVAINARARERTAAMRQAFAVLNALRAEPPTQAEIDQQLANFRRAAEQRVAAWRTTPSPALANGLVGDIDRGYVSAAPEAYRDLLDAMAKTLTPAAVWDVTKRLLAPTPRLVVLSPLPEPGGVAAAAAALSEARAVAGAGPAAVRLASLDELKRPGPPGAIVRREAIADLGIARVWFANGVELRYKPTAFEADRIRWRIAVGRGLLGRPPGDPGLLWTAGALGAAGVGPFSPEELARLAAGRQLGFGARAETDAVTFSGATSRADLADALRLATGALIEPRFAPAPVVRLRAQATGAFQMLSAQPASVLTAFGAPALYGGDARFRAVPPPAEARALTPQGFEAFWRAELARGPITVEVVGDLDGPALERAVAASLGALPPRAAAPPPRAAVRATPPPGGRAVLQHAGDPDQAAVGRAFPTLGNLQDVAAQRALSLAAAMIQTRLNEEFREGESGTYTPFASHAQQPALPDYGLLLAAAQVSLARRADFLRALDRIVADLAANGPAPDALARAKATEVSGVERARVTNPYWLNVLSTPLDDPRQVEAWRTSISGRRAIDAAAVQAVVRTYLAAPGAGFVVEALPKGAGAVTTGQGAVDDGAQQ